MGLPRLVWVACTGISHVDKVLRDGMIPRYPIVSPMDTAVVMTVFCRV